MKRFFLFFEFFFVFLATSFCQEMHKVMNTGGSSTEIVLCKDSICLASGNSILKINEYTNKFSYKWCLKDSTAEVAYYRKSLIDGNVFFDVSRFTLKRQGSEILIKKNLFWSVDPLTYYMNRYRESNPDSVNSILFDISLAEGTTYMGVLYPAKKQLSIWKYLDDSTYVQPPFGIGIYSAYNSFNWQFIDKTNVDSLSDFLICKTANGFLIAKSDGESFILHNSAKTDQRTLPKSAKFLFIQEEHQCTIMSVDANGNTVASTIYTW